ncbi:MAG: LptA/OstA family protein, partial [Steroidobacteraceae bacterium]
RADSYLVARGHADQIVYEVAAGTVRLSNDAWITDGRNDIRGPMIVYSLREEHVEASTSPGTDTRVHVTIAPSEAPKADSGTNRPKPADAPLGTPAAVPQPPAPQSAPPQSTPPQ